MTNEDVKTGVPYTRFPSQELETGPPTSPDQEEQGRGSGDADTETFDDRARSHASTLSGVAPGAPQ